MESLKRDKSGIKAVVRGQYDYEVAISISRGSLQYECDCPMGDDGDFCKHCVAASLAFLRDPAPKAAGKEPTVPAAAKLFAKQPPEDIGKLLAEWAQTDPLLTQRLLHFAARKDGPEKAVAAARKAFEKAATPRRYLGYGETAAFAEDVDLAIDAIEELIADGYAGAVVDLCEDALEILSESAEMIHEDGEITDLTDRLLELHLRACRESVTDPIALAQRLFELELEHESDAFHRTAQRYKDILGPAGLIAFRVLAEKSDHPDLGAMRESIARASGDVDALVAILARSLPSPYVFRQIIDAFTEAGRNDEALSWAERGAKAFPKDLNLITRVADMYHQRGDHAAAMKLVWPLYTGNPALHAYTVLEQHATRAGEWPEWRDNAIGLVRKRIAAAKGKTDHSLLVEIFLYEKKTSEAWQEAQKGNCNPRLWMTLAEAREKDHPEDAAPIYLRQAEEEVKNTRNSDYSNPVALLIRTAEVMKRMGAAAEFTRKLDSLRLQFKAKRNFIKLLESHRAKLYR